jgi:hypothetical protein
VGAGFFFSACDWRQRHVTVVNITHVTVNRQGGVNRPAPARTAPVAWQHDPAHRRGVAYHTESLQQRFGGTPPAGQRRDFRWQGPLAPATRNSSLNRPDVHGAHPRPNAPGMDARSNPRRPDAERAARPDGRSTVSANPAAARSGEARPEIHGPVSRPPTAPVTAAPQAHAGPGNAPRVQSPAPQPVAPANVGRNPQAKGFTDRGQAGKRPAPPAAKAHGDGHGR